MRNKKTHNMAIFAMLLAVEVVMSFTPLGFLRYGLLSITMLHIPVIICAMMLGKKYGAALGFVMGFCSFYINTTQPGPTSFIFTPFYSFAGVDGNFGSLLIAFLPRIALGYVSGWLYEKFRDKNGRLVAAGCGLCGSLINTIGVMGGIFLLFKAPYEAAIGSNFTTLLMTTVSVNSLAEIIIAVFATSAIHQAMRNKL